MLTHHRLKVYEKALALGAGAEELSALDVYQVGLDFMRWFVSLPVGRELSDRLCREVDKSATSVVLNVAEGNGRYSEVDCACFFNFDPVQGNHSSD